MRTILLAAALSLGGCAALPPPQPPRAPINVVNSAADWRGDVAHCQQYVASAYVPIPSPAPAATECEQVGYGVVCREGRPTGGFAEGYNESRKAMGGDLQDQQRMFVVCMTQLGWR